MQKFSAFKNCLSSSQRFFSTNSRCISEICTAGPPKDNSPILAKVKMSDLIERFVSAVSVVIFDISFR
jgi:hypothetical protein